MSDEIEIFASGLTQDISLFVEPILEDVRLDVVISETREDVQLNVQPNFIEINLIRTVASAFADITGLPSDNAALNSVLNAKADLVDGKVPSAQLPSYVDDVIEVANFAALPATGESGKIYITINNNKIYRWSGSTYVEIVDSTAVWGAITGTLSSQTDLQSALNGKFNNPTGDTTQYIAGDGSLITFPVSGQAGTLVREVRNTTGATLTKGTVVYISGATGNKPTISKAIATGDSTSAQTFGLLQANIANNANGYVVCVGDLTGLDTSAISEGAQLYLSSTTAGTYTTTKQLAPAHLVYIGVVTRSHPTLGQIEVKIQNGYELDEIHDVAISSKVNNQFLVYESASDLWKNKSLGTVLGGTSSQFVKGNGTLDSNTYYLASNPNGYTTNVGTVTSVGLSTTTPGVLVNFSPITSSGTITLDILASSSEDTGLLRSTDWNTFNGKQNAITLTTTGTSGAATLVGSTLNIPQYAPNLSGYVPTSRTLTINGTAFDLTANRSWSVGTVTSVGLTSATSGVTIGSSPITTSGNITLAIATASNSQNGLLSSTDWNTFNNKQNALTNPITGTGTTNFLAKYTSASTIGNSLVYDNGTNVGIGTTSPYYSLDLTGQTIRTARLYSASTDTRMYLQNTTSGNPTTDAGLMVGLITNDAYFFNYQAGNAIFGTSATERLRITSAGNVGIGTTSPSYILQTKASSGFVGAAFSSYYASTAIIGTDNNGVWFGQGTNGLGVAYVANNTSGFAQIEVGGSPRFFVNSSGNVGIGTTSPDQVLTVIGNVRAGGVGNGFLLDTTGANYTNGMKVVNNYETVMFSGRGSSGYIIAGDNNLRFGFGTNYSAGESIRITSSSNVGIGTTSPNVKLTVEGILASKPSGINAYYSYLKSSWTADNAFELGISDDGVTNFNKLITSSNYYFGTTLQFWTSNTERARFDGSGRLGIGTTSPSQKLDVSGNINVTGYALIGGSAYLASGNNLYFDSGVTNDYSIKKSGTSLAFTTGGNFTFSGDVNVASGSQLYLTAGDLRYNSNAGYGIVSQNGSRLVVIQNGAMGVNGTIKTGTLTSGTAAAPFKIGQVTSGVPTIINKLEIEIDGVTYYIPASIGTVF